MCHLVHYNGIWHLVQAQLRMLNKGMNINRWGQLPGRWACISWLRPQADKVRQTNLNLGHQPFVKEGQVDFLLWGARLCRCYEEWSCGSIGWKRIFAKLGTSEEENKPQKFVLGYCHIMEPLAMILKIWLLLNIQLKTQKTLTHIWGSWTLLLSWRVSDVCQQPALVHSVPARIHCSTRN